MMVWCRMLVRAKKDDPTRAPASFKCINNFHLQFYEFFFWKKI